jgi:hypothetical protein
MDISRFFGREEKANRAQTPTPTPSYYTLISLRDRYFPSIAFPTNA